MIRLRTTKLLSGVSTLAVLATFGAVDPVLAAGTTVTGPGFFVNIDTTVLNPPGTTGGNNDFIVVENDAIITTSGGRSFFNPATINVGTGATAVYIDDSVLQGSFVNNGTLTGAGTAVIFDNSSRLEGAFTNTGTITGGNDGIAVQNSSQLLGGITNTLGLIEGASNGIRIDTSASVTGGVTNSGSITGGSTGILVTGGSLAGGISNTGTAALISGATGGVTLDAGSLSGGLTNGGTIEATGGTAINVLNGSTWNGALSNSGLITGVTGAVTIEDSAFAGGISNTGTIEATGGTAIYINASTFSGGISNTGTGAIVGTATAILIDADVNFSGGITNAGSIVGAQAIIVGSSNLFTGGINNDGGVMLGTAGTVIGIDANLFTGGITNSGLIDATVAGPAIDLTGLTFQGGINNSGTVQVEAGNVINVTNDLFEGGIRNSGLIADGAVGTVGTGIMINLDGGTFLGGIDNTGGNILAEAGTAILVANTVLFSGGITNGSVISSIDNFAINIDAGVPLFQGGIHNNAGTIAGGNTAIAINNPVFLGGITNAGLIAGPSAAINVAATNALFDGGITNTGTIAAEGGTAILLNGTIFNGGITNTGGVILTTGGTVISVLGGSFNGGIVNTGQIIAGTTGLAINTATTVGFTGGINNSGLIQGGANGTVSGTTAISINDTVFFSGGIVNSGTIASGAADGIGIDIQTPLFTGGIANNGGRIIGFDTAINVAGTTFEGGIANTGSIVSTGAAFAINIANTTFAGGINNSAAGALIQGSTAINIANTTFTGGITNAGVVDGLLGNALQISTDTFTGGINNTGTIRVATGVTAGVTGILIDTTDFAGGITNSGLIQGGTNEAIDLTATNFSGGFNNSGTIQTQSSTAVYVSSVTNWTGDFTNSGTINAATLASYGTGVYLNVDNFNGNFTNSGSINGGVVSGTGVYMDGTLFSGNVTNSGLITANGTVGGPWTGLVLSHTLYGGDVLNSGEISALGTGILVDSGTTIAGSLTNSGTIDPQVGIQIDGVVLGGIINSGVILATSIAIDGGEATAGHTITQTGGLIRGNTLADGTGTIATSLNLVNGFADTFIGAGGVLDGDIDADGALDNFRVDGPFVYLRGTADAFNQLVFNGGTGAFGVNDADGNGVDDLDPFGPTGGASFNGGVVNFDAEDMQVGDAGSALIGDQATINLANNLNVIGGGTVGFLLTTDTATHGLIAAAGDVNFCSSPSPLPPALPCPALTSPTGNLRAVVDAVSFGQGTTTDVFNYENVITATGAINNSPTDIDPSTAAIDIATSSLFFTAIATSDTAVGPDLFGTDIDIELTRLEFGDALLGLGFTQNQQSVGNALEGIFDNGPGFSQQMENFFALLFSTTSPDDVLFYYDELAGAEHAQLLHTTVGLSSILNNFMQERLDATLLTTTGTQIADAAAAERRYAQALALSGSDASGGPVGYGGSHGLVRGPGGGSVWLRGFGQWANVDADPEAPGFDQDSDGLAGGFDYAVDPNATIGGALSFASTDVDFDVPGSSADVDTWQLGLYGNYGFGNFYADGMLSYAWHDIATNRVLEIPIPGGPFLAVADYDADTWSIAGELGGIWPLGRVMMQPSIGLNYTDASTDGFSETGAGAFDLTVLDSDADAFSSTLALRAFGRWTMGNTPVLPDLKLGWVHNFNADRHSFTAFMAEDSSVLFPIVSSSINEDAFLFSGGVTAGVSGNVEVFVDVNGLYGSDSSTTNASVGGRFTW